MSYNYKDSIIDDPVGSYQDKFLDYATNWEDDDNYETKRVKIISVTREDREDNMDFEDIINSYIEKNKTEIKIFDIKYQKNSIMIIYETRKK
jgi:hypothetical protein